MFRAAFCAFALQLSLVAVQAQDDVSGHPTTDSPYLRSKSAHPSPGAAASAAPTLSQADQKFISQVAASGAVEVADGKAAESQGGAGVKQIASRIVADRSANNQELMALAKKKGIGLGLDKIRGRNMGKSNFDKQYLHTVTRDYEQDVSLFQKAAQSSSDKDVKAYASRTVPMLKQHLAMLKSAKPAEGKGTKE